jgi:hypothetical protein
MTPKKLSDRKRKLSNYSTPEIYTALLVGRNTLATIVYLSPDRREFMQIKKPVTQKQLADELAYRKGMR